MALPDYTGEFVRVGDVADFGAEAEHIVSVVEHDNKAYVTYTGDDHVLTSLSTTAAQDASTSQIGNSIEFGTNIESVAGLAYVGTTLYMLAAETRTPGSDSSQWYVYTVNTTDGTASRFVSVTSSTYVAMCATADNNLYLINIQRQVTKLNLSDKSVETVYTLQLGRNITPIDSAVVHDGVLYIGTWTALYSVNISTGVGTDYGIRGIGSNRQLRALMVLDNNLHGVNPNGTIFRITPSGTVAYKSNSTDNVVNAADVVGNTIYFVEFVDDEHEFGTLDVSNGVISPIGSITRALSAMFSFNNKIYGFDSDGHASGWKMYTITTSGTITFVANIPFSGNNNRPLGANVLNNVVYLHTRSIINNFVILNVADGSTKTIGNLLSSSTNGLAVIDNTLLYVFVGNRSSSLYSINTSDASRASIVSGFTDHVDTIFSFNDNLYAINDFNHYLETFEVFSLTVEFSRIPDSVSVGDFFGFRINFNVDVTLSTNAFDAVAPASRVFRIDRLFGQRDEYFCVARSPEFGDKTRISILQDKVVIGRRRGPSTQQNSKDIDLIMPLTATYSMLPSSAIAHSSEFTARMTFSENVSGLTPTDFDSVEPFANVTAVSGDLKTWNLTCNAPASGVSTVIRLLPRTVTRSDLRTNVGNVSGPDYPIDSPSISLTQPTPTPDPPEFKQIPGLWMKRGEEKDIALDQYVSGLVNDTADGITLTGNPDWVSLSVGTGINRTLQIEPPSDLVIDDTYENFGRYDFRAKATGPGGSDSVTVYIYVEKEVQGTPSLTATYSMLPSSAIAHSSEFTARMTFSENVSGLTTTDFDSVEPFANVTKAEATSDAKIWNLTANAPASGVSTVIRLLPRSVQRTSYSNALGPDYPIDSPSISLTQPTPTPDPPEFKQIPGLWMKRGEEKDIALDQYVSGLVNDTADGITLTGNPDWVSLSVGTGINRTLQIEPPSDLVIDDTYENFGRYDFRAKATGPGGSDSVTVYIYVEKEPESVVEQTEAHISHPENPVGQLANLPLTEACTFDITFNKNVGTSFGTPETVSRISIYETGQGPTNPLANAVANVGTSGTTTHFRLTYTPPTNKSGYVSIQVESVNDSVPVSSDPIPYDTTPEPTPTIPPPEFKQIPGLWMKRGETKDISIDEYVSGNVNNTAAGIELTGNPDWVSLSVGTGINRTLQIEPPSDLVIDDTYENFGRFDFTAKATGPGGSDSVTVYIYVEKEQESDPIPPTPIWENIPLEITEAGTDVDVDLNFGENITGLTLTDIIEEGVTNRQMRLFRVVAGVEALHTDDTPASLFRIKLQINARQRGNVTLTLKPNSVITQDDSTSGPVLPVISPSIPYDTFPEDVPKVPPPVIRPIPVQLVNRGATRMIALDQYISGDVNPNGVGISGNPSWITLSDYDPGDTNTHGSNRTITVEPPDSITENTQYFFEVQAVGPGGSDSQRVSVYVLVPSTAPAPPASQGVTIIDGNSDVHSYNPGDTIMRTVRLSEPVDVTGADRAEIDDFDLNFGTLTTLQAVNSDGNNVSSGKTDYWMLTITTKTTDRGVLVIRLAEA